MRGIIQSSLRYRLLVVALAAGVIVVGVAQLRSAPVDVLPEFTPPYAEIQTEALGLSAVEVENLITVPLEADLLNGVENVDVIRSESLPGLSSIVLVFEPGTDVYQARQLVQERLSHAHALPRVSKPPTLLQPLSSSSRVLMIGIASDRVSEIERSVIARWTMRPRLMGVPGVANVAIWGMRDQQIQVQVDPERLRDRGVTLDDVIETSGNAQIVSPLSFLEASTPGSGGFIETPQQRLQVRNVLERLADPDELGKVPLEDARRLRLSDVADIRVDHQPLIGDAIVGDGDGLLLVVEKFPGADTAEVTREVERALESLAPGLDGIRTDTSLFRPASFVQTAIDNLTLALLAAAALVVLGLVALLRQWRTVLAALAAIPVSLITAALVLDLLGETFNAISFAGLALAVALVVDDAVVGAEAVGRRLRESGAGRPPLSRVVLEATHEVRRPLAYAAVISLLVVLPIVVLKGRPGAFFEPLALAYALAILAATVVALTVLPAVWLLLAGVGSHGSRESRLVRGLRPGYGAALARLLRRPRATLIATGACLALTAGALALLDASPVPSFKDRDVLVALKGEPGTSQPRMTQIATALGRELRGMPGVENAAAHVGRAITGDERVDVNSGQVSVAIDPDADHDATLRDIERVVARVPGVESDVATYSERRMRDVGALRDGDNHATGDGLAVLTGTDDPLVARVYGHDLATLPGEAERVRRAMAEVDGVVDPRIEAAEEQPNLVIEVDLERAHRHGIKPGDVRRAEAALLQGIQVGSVFEDQKVFEVLVVGTPSTRRGIDSVRDLLIDKPDGGHVRLGEVADVRIEPTPVAIEREAVSRFVEIRAGVEGRGVDAVAADVRARIAAMSLPLEHHAEVVEESAGGEAGLSTVITFAVVGAAAALLLFQAAFSSWKLAAAGFLLVPASLFGGALTALASGVELSLGAMLGLLALLALAARAVLLTMDHLQAGPRDGDGGGAHARVAAAAQERLTPVLTSAAAVMLLCVPFVVLGDRAGLEIVRPLAIVLLGGTAGLALVTLFLVPALFARFEPAVAPPPAVLVTQLGEVRPAGQPAGAVAGEGGKLGGLDQPPPDPRPHESGR